MEPKDALFEFLLRMGDNTLILGHRISEWCGKAPVLEEDIALANTALDLIGQTQNWLGYAAEIQGNGKSADDLAFLRDFWDFRNLLLLEQPNRDFGHTMMRQFLFDAHQVPLLKALENSSDERIAAIAAKSGKEAAYHLERSSETMIALGDGTETSHQKMQAALDRLWPFTGEMFVDDKTDKAVAGATIAPLPSELRATWEATVRSAIGEATLILPDDKFTHSGGRTGKQHSEHLGHILSSMQWLQRAYPGAAW